MFQIQPRSHSFLPFWFALLQNEEGTGEFEKKKHCLRSKPHSKVISSFWNADEDELHFRNQQNDVQLTFSFYNVILCYSNQKVKNVSNKHNSKNYKLMKHIHCLSIDCLSKVNDITEKEKQTAQLYNSSAVQRLETFV